MRKILVALCFISIMIGGCSSQTNKKNTESDSTKNTVKENIFVNISDSKTHFPLYVGGASSSVEIDIPITKEIEKKVLENNKYETQYYIDFKLNDSDDKQNRLCSGSRILLHQRHSGCIQIRFLKFYLYYPHSVWYYHIYNQKIIKSISIREKDSYKN